METKLPSWAEHLLKPEDLKGIEEAVAQVEKETDGEIIPMIVRASSSTWSSETVCALLGVILALLVNDSLDLAWFWALALAVVAAGVGMFLGRQDSVHRFLSPKEWLMEEVAQRAEIEFYRTRLHHTERKTGILIFLSLAERRVLVLGDQAINSRFEAGAWESLVAEIVQGIRNGQLGTALRGAIEKSGHMLKTHFPRHSNDINELPNHLVFKE